MDVRLRMLQGKRQKESNIKYQKRILLNSMIIRKRLISFGYFSYHSPPDIHSVFSLYPSPFTVTSETGLDGFSSIFSRILLIWAIREFSYP